MAAGVPPAGRFAGNPWLFALLTAALYTAFLLPPLCRAGFDPSLLIVAGDRYVDARATPSPILVRRHSDGYDGQFYYALASAPGAAVTGEPGAAGVTFDHPAWRAQRILYPLLAYALAIGSPRVIPAALLFANCAALVMLAALARTMLPLPFSALLVLWPGFFATLTHDTTELAACALLLGAVLLFLRGHMLPFALAAALAALTREDAILLPFGIALYTAARCTGAERVRILSASAAAMLPAIAWHVWLGHAQHATGLGAPTAMQLSFPFAGAALRIIRAITAFPRRPLPGFGGFILRAYAVAVPVFVLLTILGLAITAIRTLLRNTSRAPIAAALLCMLALDSLLSAAGPWIDATALYRATSEPWCLGCIVLASARKRLPRPALPTVAIMAAINAILLYGQIRA